MTIEPLRPAAGLIEDATCPACGLLCDDLVLTVSGGRIAEAARACERGTAWFRADHRRDDLPPVTVDGQPAPEAEAVDRAAAILLGARSPAIIGLSSTTIEAQALAALLADRLGAAIGPDHAAEARPRIAAMQRAGAALASFGEVVNRADLIVLWGIDPAGSHPRLRERLIDRPGRFVPDGREGRTILVVDEGASDCRGWADDAIAVARGRHAAAIDALRGAIRGVEVDPARIAGQTGASHDAWQAWADRLKAARYGVVMFGEVLSQEGAGAIEALMRLLDDLNRITRCVAAPLAGRGNPTGAEAVLIGRFGTPTDVDLAAGFPRFLPGDADPERRIRGGEADAVLVIGEPPGGSPTEWPGKPTTVIVGPGATAHSAPGVVAIATATPAIDDGGTFLRSDDVALPLRPALGPNRPSARAILASLLARCSPDRLPRPDAEGRPIDPPSHSPEAQAGAIDAS